MKKVISGLTVVAGKEMNLLEDVYIVIEGELIQCLGQGSPPNCDHHYCGNGLVAAPALINAHTHIADGVGKEAGIGLPMEKAVFPPNSVKDRLLQEADREKLYRLMRLTMKVMVRLGILTFCDFREGGFEGTQQLAFAASGIPIKTVILGRAGEDELVDELPLLVDNADGFAAASMTSLSEDAWAKVKTWSRDNDKLVALHVSETNQIRDRSLKETGKSDLLKTLEMVDPDFMVHLTQVPDSELNQLAASGIPVVICPRSNALLGLGLPPISQFLEKNITVGLGTDNGMLNSPNLWREMEFCSKAIRCMCKDPTYPEPVEIFKMATINGARVLGLDHSIGSVESGKLADLVFVDFTTANLCYSHNIISSLVHRVEPDDIKAVMARGKLVYGNL